MTGGVAGVLGPGPLLVTGGVVGAVVVPGAVSGRDDDDVIGPELPDVGGGVPLAEGAGLGVPEQADRVSAIPTRAT